MKKFNIPLFFCALYLIAAYPITFWIHEEYAYYPGCSGMGCVVGNMITAIFVIILFLLFIIVNFIITAKIVSRSNPKFKPILSIIHYIMIGILLILFGLD